LQLRLPFLIRLSGDICLVAELFQGLDLAIFFRPGTLEFSAVAFQLPCQGVVLPAERQDVALEFLQTRCRDRLGF
jgi:hypothetical protein